MQKKKRGEGDYNLKKKKKLLIVTENNKKKNPTSA